MRDKPSPELMRALETLGKRPVQPPATPQEPESPYKPCPFCGGQAEKIAVDEASNMGGYVVTCCSCDASSAVVFPVKDSPDGLLNVLWNRRASTPSPEGQTTWQPIETAPKDGRMVLLFPSRCWAEDSDRGEVGYWDNDFHDWGGLGSAAEDYTGPTHWMPLPSPPTPEGTQP